MPKIVVVLPTYNERPNVEKLIPAIFALAIPELEVLVVDDNSPDKTAEAVAAMQTSQPRLHLLRRAAKQGLGPAYIAGFAKARELGAELIMEMDADFSHDPAYIPKFLEAAQTADVVLGSRYVAGGGVRNWNWSRRLISWFGNIYARLILGLPYHDLTGGFKCFHASAIAAIDWSQVSSLGYNFQIETTYRLHQQGKRIVELPIIFVERREGSSKFSLRILLESFWKIIRLRTQRPYAREK